MYKYMLLVDSSGSLSACHVCALYTLGVCLNLPLLLCWDIIIRDRQTKRQSVRVVERYGGLECSNSVCSL